MSLPRLALLASFLLACGSSGGGPSNSDGGSDDPGGDGGGGGGGDGGGGDDEDDRRAEAIVQIIEQHVTDPELRNGSAYAWVLPFAGDYEVCNQVVVFEGGGCVVSEYQDPVCNLGCGESETCVVDASDGCAPKCVPLCDLSCDEGTVCSFGDDGEETCVAEGVFDAAGDISVQGLSMAAAFSPPTYQPMTFTTPVFAAPTIEVSAAGAQSAGVGSFAFAMAPPADVVASPALASLSQEDFESDLELSWLPGNQTMEIDLFASGTSGYRTAHCELSDSGQFTIPAGVFATFPADLQAIRIDLRRVAEQTSTVDTVGNYQGYELPDDGIATLRLIRLETATVPVL